jgi:WD40 repeat protein
MKVTRPLLAAMALLSCVGLCQQVQLWTQLGHSGVVDTASFSPDGNFVLTGSQDGSAVLWDVKSGREVRMFVPKSTWVRPSFNSIAFSPDGRDFASANNDRVARLWDLATGAELRRFEGHSSFVDSVAFAPDGKTMATGGADQTVRLWDVATGRELRRFQGHADRISSVSFSPDGNLILSSSLDHTARLWDVTSGKEFRRFEGPTGAVLSAAFSPNGQFVLTGGEDLTARIWEVASGYEIHRLIGHTKQVQAVAFSPDGRLAATGGFDNVVRFWDVQSGLEIRQFVRHAGDSSYVVWSLAFSPNGQFLLIGCNDRKAIVLQVKSGDEVHSFESSADGVSSVSFSPDGTVLLTAGGDQTARLWNLKTGQAFHTFVGHSRPLDSASFSPDGRSILTSSSDGTARVWDLKSGLETRRFDAQAGSFFTSSAFSPDGRRVVTGSVSNTAEIWDVATGSKIRQFAHAWPVQDVAYSPDGRWVLTGGDRTAILWDTTNGSEVRRFTGFPTVVSSVAFSPDGRFIIVGDLNRSARLINTNNGSLVREITDTTGAMHTLAFSRNGGSVVSGGMDGTAALWDIGTGNQIKKFVGHRSLVNSVALSSDESLAVTGSGDGTARIWNTSTGNVLVTLNPFRDGDWGIVSPDGRFDSNQLDRSLPLHWVIDDQPFVPLPLEIFMRDYYEPELLPRLLSCEALESLDPNACAKEFKPVRPLESLNRVQPLVEVHAEWKDEAAGIATVCVNVQSNSNPEMKNGKTFTKPYDVRLFRDGQLVEWGPKTSVEWQLEAPPTGPNADEEDLVRWREKTEVKNLDAKGVKELPFLVQVPRRADLKQVVFTAYAFNEDRVKSATASATLVVDRPLRPRIGKAYLITVGVNRTESSPAWDLHYAANDARQMSQVLGDKLERTKQFVDVVRIRLVSDIPEQHKTGEVAATKAHLEAVLDVLAGRRRVDEQLKKEISGIEVVEKAEPEDLVLLSFSSHGFTDTRGVFHIVLEDIGPHTPQTVNPKSLRNSLSSDVLSGWLRDVDAGEMTMIVDACHSEATVAAEGFKPGPMGSRGLGQLAYDKGMRILAASKSNEEAMELGGTIKQGLLSYALVEEGLVEDKAATDGKVYMAGWLNYGEQEVPNLYKSGQAKGTNEKQPLAPNGRDIIYLGHDQAPPAYQQPVLFDFNKQQRDTLITSFVER